MNITAEALDLLDLHASRINDLLYESAEQIAQARGARCIESEDVAVGEQDTTYVTA